MDVTIDYWLHVAGDLRLERGQIKVNQFCSQRQFADGLYLSDIVPSTSVSLAFRQDWD